MMSNICFSMAVVALLGSALDKVSAQHSSDEGHTDEETPKAKCETHEQCNYTCHGILVPNSENCGCCPTCYPFRLEGETCDVLALPEESVGDEDSDFPSGESLGSDESRIEKNTTGNATDENISQSSEYPTTSSNETLSSTPIPPKERLTTVSLRSTTRTFFDYLFSFGTSSFSQAQASVHKVYSNPSKVCWPGLTCYEGVCIDCDCGTSLESASVSLENGSSSSKQNSKNM